MTGSIPLWTLTLKRDERSSRPHFSSSNWAAIIREGFSYPFTPAVSLLHLSSIALTLILGEVEERFCCFKSFLPMLAMLLLLLFRGQQDTFVFDSHIELFELLSASEQQDRKASFFHSIYNVPHKSYDFSFCFHFCFNIFGKLISAFIQYSCVFVYLLNIYYMQHNY